MSIFDHIKRSRSFPEYKSIAPREDNRLFFLLQFDAQGAFIDAIGKDGKSTEFYYCQYSGFLRSVAKTTHAIRDRNHFTID